jgi:hypothetical protein
MPKTGKQPKPRPPRGSHTKGQPRHQGKGSPKTHNSQLKKGHL